MRHTSTTADIATVDQQRRQEARLAERIARIEGVQAFEMHTHPLTQEQTKSAFLPLSPYADSETVAGLLCKIDRAYLQETSQFNLCLYNGHNTALFVPYKMRGYVEGFRCRTYMQKMNRILEDGTTVQAHTPVLQFYVSKRIDGFRFPFAPEESRQKIALPALLHSVVPHKLFQPTLRKAKMPLYLMHPETKQPLFIHIYRNA